MDPRRFAFFALPDRTLALGLAVAAIVGIPALVLAIVLLGTVVTWSRGVPETMLAHARRPRSRSAPACSSPGSPRSLASFLLATRRSREVMGVIGLLLIVMAAPVIVALTTLDWANSGLAVLGGIADVLGWTPLGAAFAVPGDAAEGAVGRGAAEAPHRCGHPRGSSGSAGRRSSRRCW